MADVEEELQQLDFKMKQLKLAYDQYFLGTRPREPAVERRDVDRLVVSLTNTAITNTGQRFKFNSLCSRYNAFKRQWNETLRKIEQGTYERHVFRAGLHERARAAPPARGGAPAAASRGADDPKAPDLFEAYLEARRSCGQDCAGISREKLHAALSKQEEALRQKTGARDIRFQVVVEDGKAKIRARGNP